jgi:hypothetical protein
MKLFPGGMNLEIWAHESYLSTSPEESLKQIERNRKKEGRKVKWKSRKVATELSQKKWRDWAEYFTFQERVFQT